ncbi:DUF389 domain-containing protein [Thermoleophilia bacterium SCSIO 60948]|nr:DUF389 domain-containing protein [Thermoleophilia bacterium SCSIO 60948]
MIHLRIVCPRELSEQAQEILSGSDSACNLVVAEGAARRPEGDLILCDVAREDASVLIGELRELGIGEDGSIALDDMTAQISRGAIEAEKAARGMPSDAIVWEEIESHTSEEVELSATFLAFMVIAISIAAVGIITDQIVLIIGAMVVGPEFGPLAALAVAVVERRGDLARKSTLALLVGFPLGIAVAVAGTLVLDAVGLIPANFESSTQEQTGFIAHPDAFSVVVASLAGMAGVLSLTSAKSGALVGVLISVTTIPAAGGIGVALALGEAGELAGSAAQLGINLGAILATSIIVLTVERINYERRRRRHDDSGPVRSKPPEKAAEGDPSPAEGTGD